MSDDLARRFTAPGLSGDQSRRCREIRATAFVLAKAIAGLAPESRERALAIARVEEAVFWANAAIARNE